MNKLIILLFTAAILASCDKKGPVPDSVQNKPDYRDTLTGQWAGKAWDASVDENLTASTWEGIDTISITKENDNSIHIKSRYMDMVMQISPADTRLDVLQKNDSIPGEPIKKHCLSFEQSAWPSPSLTLSVYHYKNGILTKNSRIYFARRFSQ